MLFHCRPLALLVSVSAILWFADSAPVSRLWSSKLGNNEVDAVWRYRRGEINGDEVANKIASRSWFAGALLGATAGGGMGFLFSGGPASGPLSMAAAAFGAVVGGVVGAWDPLGAASLAGDSSVERYNTFKAFFALKPDEAVARAYRFFGESSDSTADGLNKALSRKRVLYCDAVKKDEYNCEMTEYHFELIRADSF